MCPSAASPGLDLEQKYSALIDDLVRQSVTTGQHSWDSLLQSLPGIYPTLVKESLERQGLISRVHHSEGRGLLSVESQATKNSAGWEGDDFPTPHPLDSSWWFDSPTTNRLILLMREFTSTAEHVIFLGTPTLLAVASRAEDDRSFTLVDCDPLVTGPMRRVGRRVTVVRADITNDSISLSPSKLIFSDPPWYDPEIRGFLWAARQACVIDGHVMTSYPPIGTRPGIEQDWHRFIEWTRDLGLELCGIQRSVLSYLSPVFEQNALRAASMPSLGGPWRRGDLAVFRCVAESRCQRPPVVPVRGWSERTIGRIRIRLRAKDSVSGWEDPSLNPITKGDILRSVSRRDPLRAQIDVWTSGNRVFACSGIGILRIILDSVASGGDSIREIRAVVQRELSADEELIVRQTEAELTHLVQVEEGELSEWRRKYARLDSVGN